MPTIDFSLMVQPALLGITRAWVFMGLGVNAALDPDYDKFSLPDVPYIQLLPDNLPNDTVEGIKREFAVWIVSNGLRELIETWDVFLDRLYHAALSGEYWQQSRHAPSLSPDSFTKRANAFPRKGTSEKLVMLRDQFGISLQFQPEIESIKQARNCLTHRMGVVGPEDVDTGGLLMVCWRSPELFGRNEDGSEFVPSLGSFPIDFPPGSGVMFRNAPRTKIGSIGDRLTFTPAELKEICYTFRIAVEHTRESFTAFVTRIGGTVSSSPLDGA
jgi:hypothetical protein